MKKLVLIFVFVFTAFCQEKDPRDILNSVKEKFSLVQDYVVDADINVDVSFLQVPESHATIYFKAPDKIKLNSEGFALLPKQGLNFSPSMLLASDYTAIYIKEDTLDGRDVDVIKVIPNSDTTDLVLSTLWIDMQNDVVKKIEATTKKQGTIILEFDYEDQIKYSLPSLIKFTFKVDDVQLPMGMPGASGSESSPQMGSKKRHLSGSVIVNYKNYRVNQGLEDSFFEEKKKN